jgi:hypothetical protein
MADWLIDTDVSEKPYFEGVCGSSFENCHRTGKTMHRLTMRMILILEPYRSLSLSLNFTHKCFPVSIRLLFFILLLYIDCSALRIQLTGIHNTTSSPPQGHLKLIYNDNVSMFIYEGKYSIRKSSLTPLKTKHRPHYLTFWHPSFTFKF